MDDFIRYKKPCSDCGQYGLFCYNITVNTVPPQDFFSQVPAGANPPLTGLDPALIDSPLQPTTDVSDDTYHFLTYLNLTVGPDHLEAMNDFAHELLRMVGYEERGFALLTNYTLPNYIGCGSNERGRADVCLLDRRLIILLILKVIKLSEETSLFSHPEPQVIGEAVAVYQLNNQKRASMGISRLDMMTVPCITLCEHTRPTFYLVPVTEQLSTAVMYGRWPEVETTVARCVTFAGYNHSSSEGMVVPVYRKLALQRLIAFKDLAKTYWEAYRFTHCTADWVE